MKKIFFVLASLVLVPGFSAQAASDFLARKSFDFRAEDPDGVLEKTVADLRGVFRRYVPVFDSSTKIVRPLKIGGSASHPTMNVVARKCVLFVCKEVEIDASISIRETNGNCGRNYALRADLARSSDLLSDNYDSLTVNICYDAAETKARLKFEGYADRASRYSEGTVTKEILKMLALQVEPMTNALQRSLEANGARRVRLH